MLLYLFVISDNALVRCGISASLKKALPIYPTKSRNSGPSTTLIDYHRIRQCIEGQRGYITYLIISNYPSKEVFIKASHVEWLICIPLMFTQFYLTGASLLIAFVDFVVVSLHMVAKCRYNAVTVFISHPFLFLSPAEMACDS